MIVNTKGHGNKFEHTTNQTRLYNEIRANEVLTKEQELALFHVIKHGTKSERDEAISKITNANMKFVVSIARAYATNYNLEELISEGAIGLLEAIDHFNPQIAIEKGVKFTTFAVEYIRRNIVRYRIDYGTIVKQTNRAKTIHFMSKAKNSFMQKYERQPTSDELLDWLNENYLDEKHKLDNPNDVMDVQYPSIDEPFEMGDDEDMGNSGLMFSYNTETQQINGHEVSEEAEYNTHLLDEVLKSVDSRDANIIKMCYGIGYPHPISISEISERTRLTPERVRQIRASVIKKLKGEYSKKHLGLI